MVKSTARNEIDFLGRAIGTCTGWDMADSFAMIFYDFIPYPSVHVPMGDIVFSEENGLWETYDGAGNVVNSGDIIELLKDVPRKEPIVG